MMDMTSRLRVGALGSGPGPRCGGFGCLWGLHVDMFEGGTAFLT